MAPHLNVGTVVHQGFSSDDANIIFRSSDDVHFKIHSLNLRANTEGFVPPETSTLDEIVDLTETSETLGILFQFIYPARHPELEDLAFHVLAAVAEAAEKYQVFPALGICKVRMKSNLRKHATEVMAYALKHHHIDIIDLAAPYLMVLPLDRSVAYFPDHHVLSWIRYHECWRKVIQRAAQFYSTKSSYSLVDSQKREVICGGHKSCNNRIEQTIVDIIADLAANPYLLCDLDSIFPGTLLICESGSRCVRHFQAWKRSIRKDFSEIPKFSTFL